MASLIGGLWVMSGSAPLAAQTTPSATRSFSSATVQPGAELTVTINVADYGGIGAVTEMLPEGFAYVSSSGVVGNDQGADGVRFTLLGETSFTYIVTASSTAGEHTFTGMLRASDQNDHTVGGDDTVTVAGDQTGPTPTPTPAPQTGPDVTSNNDDMDNNLQFDVVSAKAVKGDRVSGVGNPIASNPLKWMIDETGHTFDADSFDGSVPGSSGFEVKRTAAGEFGLFVAESGASVSGGADSINVTVTYTNADDEMVTSTLMGDINSQEDLDITSDNEFTIPQGISGNAEDTLIGSFTVTGGIADEYLDGILSGDGSELFAVNDSDMTLVYRGGAADLEVKEYNLQLTVSGDAGLANRTDIAGVKITVTASNMAPTVPATFMATIEENLTGAGIIEAGTPVGDASAGVDARDGDVLEYSLVGGDSGLYEIDEDSGMVTVGMADIMGDDGVDQTHNFQIMVSDGITANNKYISATVIVDANSPVELVGDAADGVISITEEVVAGDVPKTLLNLDTLVNDADDDMVTITVLDNDNQTHIVHQQDASGNDLLRLTYIPEGADDLTHTVEFGVMDGFNDDGPDATFTVTVSVTELEPPPITSNFVDIKVAEGSTTCVRVMDDGTEGDCSVAGVVDGATSYSIESGVQTGNTDYDINASTGEISVEVAPDFENGNNPAFLVNANNSEGDLAGLISVRVTVTDVDEDPMITAIAGTPWVYETAQIGDPVVEKPADQAGPEDTDEPIVMMATDPEDRAIRWSIQNASKQAFAIGPRSGALTVRGDLDYEKKSDHPLTIIAMDPAGNEDTLTITVKVLNANESPVFTSPLGDDAVTTEAENVSASKVIFTFKATDADGDDLTFTLRQGQSQDLFEIKNTGSSMVGGDEVWSGDLHAKAGALDFEDEGYDPRVHVEVNDPEGLNDTLLLTVNLSNVNDNSPMFNATPAAALSVAENTMRGTVLSNYSASDADGDMVSYTLSGPDEKSFSISDSGDLMTLEALDADNAMTPCGADGCSITVEASDGTYTASASVRITVTAVEDSVSTLDVTKANPVPGTAMGNPMSALAGTKTTVSAAVPERPADLPATYGSAPMNFVATEWANWGTVLRIEVTAESPDPKCGNGNQCVVVSINSDSADDTLKLAAYRSGSQDNKYVAAVELVETDDEASTYARDSQNNEIQVPIYAHVRNSVRVSDGGVPKLKADEEDEIEVEFGNLRDSIDVENEAPEVSNFAPAHEMAFDDADVDYTFTVTDDHSGLPEPEDLPDADGDENYTPVVALISAAQCESAANKVNNVVNPRIAELMGMGYTEALDVDEEEKLYCRGTEQGGANGGEYIAGQGTWGFAPIRDDKDFDDIDNGYDVETTLVLTENEIYFVTFIVCDNAGNCAFHDPDGNDAAEELAQITVDTEEPVFVEARTGVTWDEGDSEYDDNRSFVQVIFNELTKLNPATVEVDDFVVEGHTIKDVHIYENPDDDDAKWATRFAQGSRNNKRDTPMYHDIENSVFIELEDELLADETPDVTIVPNGVEDAAGNEQDDGDHEADDWISPKFTIVSIVSPRETGQEQVLAGEDEEVVVTVTADERLDATRPTVTVTYVNAPAGKVNTKDGVSCEKADGTKSTRERGEIVLNASDTCGGSDATGGTLNNHVEKVSNTEWIVTITEPKDTGYYNFHISGKDRSPQENQGSEGVSADKIVVDFFDSDGDVNVDDAVFFEGDINLAKPNVRVSGVDVTDNEADVEYRSPLFVELDFTKNHSTSCDNKSSDYKMANCTNENSEYAEDNFDDIVVTMFKLDGVDMTDNVKTTDNQTFLISLESIALGDHTAEVQAMDQAGNMLEDTLEIDFEVNDRDPYEKRLSPGWNLVSLPGEPADSSIGAVIGSGVEVRTVYTYDPVVPGGWMVAVRETLDSDWQGDLTEITGQRGYWVLSDAIQDWEVNIPRLAGGASGTGTPIQPPSIPMYAGWNLIPVTDVTGDFSGDGISVSAYLNSLDDGLDLARVLGFDTIKNEWMTLSGSQDLMFGNGYWVFVRESGTLVPGN